MAFQFFPADPLATTALLVIIAGVPIVLSTKVSKAYGFAVLMLVVFGLELFGELFRPPPPGFFTGDTITPLLGLTPSTFLEGGQWWSPGTMIFVHAGLFHLFGNLFILLTAGPALEDRMGERAFVIVFALAGFGSSAVGVLLGTYAPTIVDPNTIMVGASGAIFGVLTAVAVLYPKLELPILLFIRVVWLPSFVVLLIYLAFNIVYIVSATNIAWYGHFAGFIVGLIAAPRLPKRRGKIRGRVDVDKLEPLALDRTGTDILERLRVIRGETEDDGAFQEAWLDRFFKHAPCPNCGRDLARDGFTVSCPNEDYELAFALAAGTKDKQE